MTDIVQVYTTLPGREQAAALARQLVEGRLAACVQIMGPLQSVYRWEGQVEAAEEWLVVAKTTTARYAALQDGIRGAHPYQTPEILALPVQAGHPDYLKWVVQEVD